uniref:Vesicle transport protein n=1 Tax=Palpitomonas bilix TaxID=652834 RepID=A0A7S3DIC6_9EUKA|mmetsp:Transcript_39272/g.100656  ORF Transcript_39272/g.100656 Transcript_39272/m.100656 type:complete len:193 (+) Transcript_39272:377-955(+)|eukprot:CAMPEP_0113882542 /NCGR_PEP_ID=MMETSP0780_2-20120614/9025_1 /TAXON_ID=652834 /ORGANISM="Palpitomonas bilix" /LENGTH=192 /DNA_ID=CAMNT_0000869593 /DNA_START=352 /DNA_END=930 /DNA_ORIENTATION=- /assembly_acc=CAM_ASM_000599
MPSLAATAAKEAVKDKVKKVKDLLKRNKNNNDEDEEEGLLSGARATAKEMCSLSLKNRIRGFAICALVGLVCGFISVWTVPMIIVNPASFATVYTIANLSLLGGTFFIVGPLRQLKAMCKPKRAVASIMYIVSLIVTIIMAVVVKSWIGALVAIVVQFFAVVWYIASYVPYGRECLKSCFKGSASSAFQMLE